MDGWNTSFLLGWPIFRCYVSFREGTSWIFYQVFVVVWSVPFVSPTVGWGILKITSEIEGPFTLKDVANDCWGKTKILKQRRNLWGCAFWETSWKWKFQPILLIAIWLYVSFTVSWMIRPKSVSIIKISSNEPFVTCIWSGKITAGLHFFVEDDFFLSAVVFRTTWRRNDVD